MKKGKGIKWYLSGIYDFLDIIIEITFYILFSIIIKGIWYLIKSVFFKLKKQIYN
jgi:hypothetical protein